MTKQAPHNELDQTSLGPGTKYRCPLGAFYVIQAPFPLFVTVDGECVEVLESDDRRARDILLKGEDITYLGITDVDGEEAKNMSILTVLKSLKEFFAGNPMYDHLVEPVEWHIEQFEQD